MLESKIIKAAEFLVLSFEHKAQTVSAVCVFKTAGDLVEGIKTRCAFYLLKAEKLTEGTALTYFDRAGLFIAV